MKEKKRGKELVQETTHSLDCDLLLLLRQRQPTRTVPCLALPPAPLLLLFAPYLQDEEQDGSLPTYSTQRPHPDGTERNATYATRAPHMGVHKSLDRDHSVKVPKSAW